MPIDKNLFDPLQISGLLEAEAADLLAREGPNELPGEKGQSIILIIWEVARDPIFLLLLISGLIYLWLGDVQESIMLMGFVFFIMGISLFQEIKTEHALQALKDLSSPRALVIRSGAQKRIPGREVVRGDTLILAEGDRVPADAKLLWVLNLSADESMLTGESMPASKSVWKSSDPQARPGGDNLPYVYSGTLIVQGRGVAEVTGTGMNTEFGKIGKVLQGVEIDKTRLQKETAILVNRLAVIAGVLCVGTVIAHGLIRGNWLSGFLAGISLAMAILPNEFPVVLTIFLALGAWRISQKGVLTRRIPAVENLGAATVLCVDKTGTLTLNQMTVQQIYVPDAVYDLKNFPENDLPEILHEVTEFGILASQRDPFDPIEKALKETGEKYLKNTEHIHNSWTLIRQYPLSPELMALSHVWESPDGDEYVIGAKGAPEAIFDLCHFDEATLKAYSEKVLLLAKSGLRVLGIAKSYFRKTDLPPKQHDFVFQFLGLVGFADPIRPEVPAAVKECYGAGIRVIMITGDYPETAANIARQIGLKLPDQVMSGPEMEKMEPSSLMSRIQNTNVFARVVPVQKLQLVNALKNSGELVAMTGDGVNDAPALKSADIGIAMGKRGTDVAREAASIVLVDDAFASIVSAVKLGRRIFDNLKKAMAYLLAIHIPIAGMSLIPVLLKWPLVLMPVHIAFLHLIIDPACSVVFEMQPEEGDAMNRPPRKREAPLFSREVILLSFLQGMVILAVNLLVYGVSLYRGLGEFDARGMTFATLVIANLGLIFTNRSWSLNRSQRKSESNRALWWVTGGGIILLAAIFQIPFLRDLFRFAPLHLLDWMICAGAGLASALWFEGFKWVRQTVDHK